ncbi:DUF5367 domain-containing protein [Cytobacillus solani]|uniref:DUF5367 domain-containing protein n=2 Tax=Cytobacillus solani TaxID=1637975 RepID=A0A0Q3RD85_9BACI|nr:DUF5367 family protein [Cytobacillus solani]KOP79415.1 hypothetical protein AMS60_17945 [Bacillus sp. FJAT-21945]KQL27625.1 hypothetical protein AN957_01530 [Cytobacillus solani]USK55338.1 DUF5367 domain-containing protein [Cytobacillus solani]
MKGHFLTVLWGVIVWFLATLFFVLFGKQVLFSPGTASFVISTLILIAGTGVLLFAVTSLYLFFDRSKNAAIKFGIIGTIIGLSLDTFSIAYHQIIFPELSHSQIIAFTVWMSFAYALYLIIPILINEVKKRDLGSPSLPELMQ